MGFCIGGAWCRTQDCKERCKGWFAGQPELERACKNACKAKSSLTKQDFLCSGNWVAQQIVFAAYGYDPCPGDEINIEDYFDPLDDRSREDEKRESLQPVIYVIGAALFFSIAVFLYLKMKK